MNAPFANIFLAVQQRISTEVSAITFVDQDMGQLRSSARPPVSWPCALIDFETFEFEDMGNNAQTAKGIIVVRLGFAPNSSSAQATPAPYKEQALGYYDVEWTLHKALQGWPPGDEYGNMCRISAATQKRNDSYRVRELRYSIAFEDYSTKWQQQYAAAALVVTDELHL